MFEVALGTDNVAEWLGCFPGVEIGTATEGLDDLKLLEWIDVFH